MGTHVEAIETKREVKSAKIFYTAADEADRPRYEREYNVTAALSSRNRVIWSGPGCPNAFDTSVEDVREFANALLEMIGE